MKTPSLLPLPPPTHKNDKSSVLFCSRDSEEQHVETMESMKKLPSTERILLLEEELAAKLNELKSELEEEQGPLLGTANRVFR